MSFANPVALWLLAGLPLVLLAHLYGVRRRTVQVTTARFFESLDPVSAEPQPAWRQFRPSWLLALQLLAVACIALALAAPRLGVDAPGYPREVLVLDVSASMRVVEGDRTRFDAAQQQLLAAIAALQPGQQAMLISSRPSLLRPLSADHDLLREAASSAQPSDRDDDMAGALAMAVDLARGDEAARIRVFSDAAFDAPGRAQAQGGDDIPVEWQTVGQRSDNAGITELRIRQLAGERGAYQLFVTLGNFGAQARTVQFELALDDATLFAQALELGAGVQRSLSLPFEHTRAGVLSARITDDDALASDNIARLVLPAPRQRNVALLTQGNLFLEEALRADRSNEVVVRPAGTLDAEADVTVIDGESPATLAPGRYLLIRTLPGNAPLEVTGEVDLPPVVDWRADHAVTRYLDLDQLLIRKALNVRVTGHGETLAESPVTPLIYAWDDGKVRAVYVGFDLHQSDLRVRAAFPMLVNNALDWLAPSRLDDLPLQQRAGSIDGLDNADLHSRGGSGEVATPVAVNLLSARESDIAPARAVPPATPAATTDTGANFGRQYLLWRWLAWLALAALVAEALLYLRRRTRSLPALVPRAAVLGLLVAALFNPALRGTTNAMHIAFAVDASASVPPAASTAARTALTSALDEGIDATSARLLDLGAGVAGQATAVTDIARTVRHAVASLPEQGHRRVVLLSDGNETTGDARAAASEAARLGVALYTVPIGGAVAGEVRLDAITVPAAVRQGDPVALRLAAWSASAGSAQITLHRNDNLIARQAVELRAGKNVLSFDETIDEAGYSVFEASISAAEDRLEQNNSALALVDVRPRPRVLLVDAEPAQSEPLRQLLAAQQIDAEVHDVASMHDALSRLRAYDGVLLSNVSSLDFSREEMAALHDYVHDAGGGLVMLGGEQSFGLGGYYQTPIEQALPVSMAVRQKLDVPSTTLVLVIDRSGSMNRFDGEFNRLSLAKEAAQRAVELLSERSEIGVLAFDMKSNWVVPIRPNADKSGVLRAIATLQAGGGGTQLMWGLQKAYRSIARRDSMIRHVIILSDGEVYSNKFPELLGNMVDKNITVSAVTIGSRTGRPQMQQISELGQGRFYYSSDASKLPRIFTMETQLAAKTALVEEPFTPVVLNRTHEVLRGVDWATLPPLDGYIATTAKRSAQTLLASHHDDPLLSVWRYGLGRAAVFTSEFKSRWGGQWMQWDESARVAAQLVRWTLRSARGAEMDVATRVEGARGEVHVDIVDSAGRPRNFLAGEARIVTPDQRQLRVPLQQYAPGRYRAGFPAKDSGGYLVDVAARGESGPVSKISSRAVQPYPAEYRALEIDNDHLAALASISGGRVLANALDVLAEPRPALPRRVPAWPWLLGIALLVLALELLARYWLERRAALAT